MDWRTLGDRLRRLREAHGMSVEEVARHLRVSPEDVSQMERGERPISGSDLIRLAYAFGEDPRDLVSEGFDEEEPFLAFFRRDSHSLDEESVEALRRYLAIGRELINMERLLGIDHDADEPPARSLPRPRTKEEAINHGERAAYEERDRLGLGMSPIANMTEVLEAQGVRAAKAPLPKSISGMTLAHPRIGCFVIVNEAHPPVRRRFSYAHEYAHVIFDRQRGRIISPANERHDLVEVRANAFAAHFLMPRDAVHRLVRRRKERDIQLYDVAHLAHHFNVSRIAVCYHLHSLGLISRNRLDVLLEQEREGYGASMMRFLELPESIHEDEDAFPHQLLSLALEAFGEGKISRAKLIELAKMIGREAEDVDRIVEGIGPIDDEGCDPAHLRTTAE